MNKKLYKSASDRKIAGVCGGIADYFGWDATWVRIAWAVLICAYGTGLMAYILAAIIMPNEP